MTPILRLSACLLVTAALTACNKSAPAAPDAPAASSSTATPADAAASADTATPPSNAPAADDTAPIALDMGKVRAWLQAQKNLGAAEQANPAIGDSAQNISEENTAQYIARLEGNAGMRQAIESANLSVSDFARIGETLLGAMMAQGALEAGQLKTIPHGIDPAAVEFVKQHKAELNAMMTGASAG